MGVWWWYPLFIGASPYAVLFDPFRVYLLRLHPLILTFILLTQLQQLLERLYSLRLQIPSVHSFPRGFQPVQHIMFFNTVTRWIPVVFLNKFSHLIISNSPSFILRHIIRLIRVIRVRTGENSLILKFLIHTQ